MCCPAIGPWYLFYLGEIPRTRPAHPVLSTWLFDAWDKSVALVNSPLQRACRLSNTILVGDYSSVVSSQDATSSKRPGSGRRTSVEATRRNRVLADDRDARGPDTLVGNQGLGL